MARSARIQICRSVASVVVAAALVGCDNDQGKANKKVEEQLSIAAGRINGGDADRADAQRALDAAAKETTASLPERIQAKVLLAHDELRTAQELAAKAAKNSTEIDRLALSIQRDADSIARNTTNIEAMKLNDPAKVDAEIKKTTADVTGSDDKPDWYKSDSGTLQSLAAADKDVAALQAKITTLQDGIKSKTDQRDQLIAKADKLAEDSEHERRQKALDLFAEGSDARKQAADLTVALDQDNIELGRAQADLGVRQAQHDQIQTTLKQLGDKSAAVAERWKAVQDEMAAAKAKSAATLGDAQSTPPAPGAKDYLTGGSTLASKALLIEKIAAENANLLKNGTAQFNTAINDYKGAYAAANQLRTELTNKIQAPEFREKPDVAAWTLQRDSLAPLNYAYLVGDAESKLAEFQSRGVAEANTRMNTVPFVKKAVEGAGLEVPEALKSPDETAVNTARKAAGDSFKDADEQLSMVYQGEAPQERIQAAKISSMFNQYGWYLLESMGGDKEKATSHLQSAQSLLGQLQNAALPPLPAELTDSVGGGSPIVPTKMPASR